MDSGSGKNIHRSQYLPYGWCGMYKDRFTGELHTHFRDYDPIHARWLSQDPAGYMDGLNLYNAYMGVNGVDYLGLDDDPLRIGDGNGMWIEHADIAVERVLDECRYSPISKKELEESVRRTHAELKKMLNEAHARVVKNALAKNPKEPKDLAKFDKLIWLLDQTDEYMVIFRVRKSGDAGEFHDPKYSEECKKSVVCIDIEPYNVTAKGFDTKGVKLQQAAFFKDLLGVAVSHELGHFYHWLVERKHKKNKSPDIWNPKYSKYWVRWIYNVLDGFTIKGQYRRRTEYNSDADWWYANKFRKNLGFDYPYSGPAEYLMYKRSGKVKLSEVIAWYIWSDGGKKKVSKEMKAYMKFISE